MALETYPVELAQYCESEAAQADDALATGHAGYIANALGIVARARGMSDLAAEIGVKRQQLYRALSKPDAGDPDQGDWGARVSAECGPVVGVHTLAP